MKKRVLILVVLMAVIVGTSFSAMTVFAQETNIYNENQSLIDVCEELTNSDDLDCEQLDEKNIDDFIDKVRSNSDKTVDDLIIMADMLRMKLSLIQFV